MSQITDASIRDAITQRLGATHVEVTDMSGSPARRDNFPPPILLKKVLTGRGLVGGCGQAFTCLIVAPQFQGLNSLKRHRLTNAALKEEIAAIHAWTAKCQTPDEWERDKAKAGPPMDGTVGGHVEGTGA
ncbi:BolA domain-containing protein [Metarhizium acridum CQMa 102]|uniref:BolA domain-containing protein n=1 Tax=Metarhizium acridum (strain CQMa 102) TaxID=655827 RepID=E9E448_METAQ|nr:BolA domain-containing protein [Metarhizium acridum CQMa 102]EFY89265.1 BolA domain-containing protein [Metarhizium acridum CQMa 102]